MAAASAVGVAVLALVTAASSGVPEAAGIGAAPLGGRRPAYRPEPRPQPAPYVQAFAEQPGVPRQTAAPSAGAPYSASAEVDGCDHDYGVPGQCVPWSFPPGVTDRCGWLVAHGFGPLAVSGRDRQRLDANHDGVACGPGDA